MLLCADFFRLIINGMKTLAIFIVIFLLDVHSFITQYITKITMCPTGGKYFHDELDPCTMIFFTYHMIALSTPCYAHYY